MNVYRPLLAVLISMTFVSTAGADDDPEYQSPNGPYLIAQNPLAGAQIAFPANPVIVHPDGAAPFPLSDIYLGTLRAIDGSGNPVVGTQFKGMTLEAVATDGSVVMLRIDDATNGVDDANPPVPNFVSYTVSQQVGPGWVPLCSDGPVPTKAVAVPGTWTGDASYNPVTGFTFACLNASVGKCYGRFGYNDNFAPGFFQGYLAACTRMLRADYCGGGFEHTTAGTFIKLGDSLVMHPWIDTPPFWPFVFEAAWGPGGATCVNFQRHVELTRLHEFPGSCPVIPPPCQEPPDFGPGSSPPVLKNKCLQGPDVAGYCINNLDH